MVFGFRDEHNCPLETAYDRKPMTSYFLRKINNIACKQYILNRFCVTDDLN